MFNIATVKIYIVLKKKDLYISENKITMFIRTFSSFKDLNYS